VSKKAKAKPPEEAVDGFAEHNAHCLWAIDSIECYLSPHRRPDEGVVECVVRLLAELQQFRADDIHKVYADMRNKRREAIAGGAR